MEEWLKKLNDEVMLLYHHLDLYKKLSEIIEKNQQLQAMDNTILAWMKRAFSLDLAVGICRICDTHPKSASFVQFLRELKNKTEYLKRERYISLYPKLDLEWANRDFDNLAGENKALFPVYKIEADINKITKEEPFNKIKIFRDKYLAHSDKVRVKITVKYDEIFNAFEILQKIIIQYNVLMRATSFTQLTPTMQGYWEEVFTIPWVQSAKQKNGDPI